MESRKQTKENMNNGSNNTARSKKYLLRSNLCVENSNNTFDNQKMISHRSVSSESGLNNIDPTFKCSQLLKEMLITLDYDENTEKNFIDFCRFQYSEGTTELRVINEFECDYAARTSIWCYNRHGFMYVMVNEALRTLRVEIIITMSFFIRDLHQQIVHLHSQSNNCSFFYCLLRVKGSYVD
jgi:hypothetical protein